MRYPGSKARYAKELKSVISERKGDRSIYLEPFLGGGNSFSAVAPMFEHKFGGDAHEDIALMWAAVAEGWLPPEHVSEDEYRKFKNEPPSALRGFIGAGCSFGGKWFGGYARGGFNGTEPRNYARESSRAISKQASAFLDANIFHREYAEWNEFVQDLAEHLVVYCDPPYAGTLEYKNKMDHEIFWNITATWAEIGALVFVSEQSAPPPWTAANSISRRSNTSANPDQRTFTDEFIYEWSGESK